MCMVYQYAMNVLEKLFYKVVCILIYLVFIFYMFLVFFNDEVFKKINNKIISYLYYPTILIVALFIIILATINNNFILFMLTIFVYFIRLFLYSIKN
jgi:hypothetical protein